VHAHGGLGVGRLDQAEDLEVVDPVRVLGPDAGRMRLGDVLGGGPSGRLSCTSMNRASGTLCGPPALRRERGALVPTDPAKHELVRQGARRVLAGDSLRGIAPDWEGRGSHGQRQR
jgi:hypothetical protein